MTLEDNLESRDRGCLQSPLVPRGRKQVLKSGETNLFTEASDCLTFCIFLGQKNIPKCSTTGLGIVLNCGNWLHTGRDLGVDWNFQTLGFCSCSKPSCLPPGSAGRTHTRPRHEISGAAALPSECSLLPSTLETQYSGDWLWLLRGSPEGVSCLFSPGMWVLLKAHDLWKDPLFSKPERAFCAHAFHLGLGSGKGAFCGLCPVFKTQRT